MELFSISDANPNEESGTGACLCSPAKVDECKPPYVIFYNHETDDPTNPYTVGCARCVKAAAKACDGEALSTTAPNTVPEVLQSAARKSSVPSAPPVVNLADQRITEPDEDGVVEAEVVEDDYDI